MAFVVDPTAQNSTNGNGSTAPPWLVAGTHVCWAADISYSTSKRGDKVIEVLFACVEGEHAGSRMFERFYLTASAAWKLAKFSNALGHNEQWDAENEDFTRDLFCSRPVVLEVTTWENNKGEDRPQIDRGRISMFRGDITEEMESRVVELENYAAGAKQRQNSWNTGTTSVSGTAPHDDIPF